MGIVAVGPSARGVVAIGQWAFGVVAVGQFAFGGIAIGVVAVGGLSAGIVSLGLYGAAGLVGAGGIGRGPFVPSLLPALPPPKRVPVPVPLAQVGTEGGWVELQLQPADNDVIAVEAGQTRADVRLDARVRRAATSSAPATVFGWVRRSIDGPVVERLREVPATTDDGRARLVAAARLVALGVVAAIIWIAAVQPWLARLPF